MARHGESFLTRPILVTRNLRWVTFSRMQFRQADCCPDCWALSWLGVLNGLPILSKHWRLACTIEEDTNQITGWSIIKASRCEQH